MGEEGAGLEASARLRSVTENGRKRPKYSSTESGRKKKPKDFNDGTIN
jgi:hypothetical protein